MTCILLLTVCLLSLFEDENGRCKPTSRSAQLVKITHDMLYQFLNNDTYPVVTKNNNNVEGINGSKSNRVKHANTLAVLIAITTGGACVFLKVS